MKVKIKYIAYISSIIFLLLVWQGAAYFINSDLILPSPGRTLRTAFLLILSGGFWLSFLLSLVRILSAFFISAIAGFLLGWLTSKSAFLRYFFEPFLIILRVCPVVALILFALFWFKSSFVPVIIAVLITLPLMITNVAKGFMKLNNEYNELALVYKLSPLKTFFLIKLPQVKSYLYSALDSIFGLSWKAVIAGEVLCLPKNALGSYIQKQSLHLESANVIAATLLLILFCFLIQKFVHFLFSCKENHNQL